MSEKAARAPIRGLSSGSRALPPDVARYLCVVRRLRRGDAFVAFDPEARTEADATLEDDSLGAARALFGEPRPARVVAGAPLVLVYALAKGDKSDAVVRDATELGVTHVALVETSRSVTRLSGARRAAKAERWRRIAEQAARQSGRADPPAVEIPEDWAAALSLAASLTETRFVLDPHAPDALGTLLAGVTGALTGDAAIAFAIGPEGGLSTEEIAAARAAGFAPVNIGPFVLRTETVAAAVLGAVRIMGS